MRIVVPYVDGHLRPETRACCDGQVEFIELSTDPTAYAAFLRDLWRAGEGFAVIEHDMLVPEKVFRTFHRCRHLWCGFPYPMSHGDGVIPEVALGCTKFSASLIAKEPDALDAACAIDDDGLTAMDWRRMDVRVARVLTLRGYRSIQHAPRVVHLHYEDVSVALAAGWG